LALLNGERRAAGEHTVHVDARQLRLPAGVYVVRIEAGREKGAVRLVLAP